METVEVCLSAMEREALQAKLAEVRDVRVQRRIYGVLLLAEQLPLDRAAQEAGLTPRTLQMWAVRYLRERRPEAVVTGTARRHRYDGIRSLLLDLVATDPRSFGYEADNWTPRLVRSHLASESRVMIPPPVISRFLATNGFAERGGNAPGPWASGSLRSRRES